ncbi:MAG: integration host factor subunit alpha [Gammaproteobacteria bacterium]
MALTKAELVEHLHKTLGINKREAKDVVESLFTEISEVLQQGEEVKLSGFGVFSLRKKGERPGRNPRTGEEATISPRTVVTFKAGEKLKAKVGTYARQSREEPEELPSS